MAMQRIAFKMNLLKGFEEEYQRRHTAIWPELADLLRSKSIRDYAIFLDQATGTLFATMIVEDPALLEELPLHPVMKKWWTYMKDIMETHEDHSPVSTPLKEVFSL